MKVIVVKDYDEMSQKAGEIINCAVKENPEIVLGLATGSTPVGTYKEMAKAHQQGLDYSKVTTFNLDEYIGLPEGSDQSYVYFMNEKLFQYLNIDRANTHFPSLSADGSLEKGAYEKEIEAAGGVDLQILGVGRNGHIAFNEPAEYLNNYTSIVNLTPSTIEANKRFFEKKEDVPTTAVSMGMGTIFRAKKILLLANGENKKEAMEQLLRGKGISTNWPVTLLHLHPDVTVIVDEAAAGK